MGRGRPIGSDPALAGAAFPARPIDVTERRSNWFEPKVTLQLRSLSLAVLLSCAVVGIGTGASALSTYSEWGTLDRSGSPPRIDWCGRRYYPGIRPLTAAEFAQFPVPAPWTQVLTTPSGQPVYATVATAALKRQFHTEVCSMLLVVRENSDRYVVYPLSGGP
jgi:hypothetical protein